MKNKKVMLRKGSSCLLMILLLCACHKEAKDHNFDHKDKYLDEHFSAYSTIYNSAQDTVQKWIRDSLKVMTSPFYHPHQVDSVFLFNSDSTIFFSTINVSSSNRKDANSDAIYDFGGRKVDDKWYFMRGSMLVLPRDYYQDSVYSALSFEKMSYLAYLYRFKYYIDNNEPIPDKIIWRLIRKDICESVDSSELNHCIDSLAMAESPRYYLNKRTKEEVIDLQEGIDESERPPEPEKESKAWWQIWKKEPPVPVFETEEWEEYLKQKYGDDWKKHS